MEIEVLIGGEEVAMCRNPEDERIASIEENFHKSKT